MTDREQLELLIHAGHPLISVVTGEEESAVNLVREVAFDMARDLAGLGLWQWSVASGLRDGLVDAGKRVTTTENAAVALAQLTQLPGRYICVMLDLGPHLSDAKTLRYFREAVCHCRQTGSHMVLIDYADQLPSVVAMEAARFEVSLPSETELDCIIREVVRRLHRREPIEVDLTRRQLQTIIRNLRGLTRRQAERIITEVVLEDHRLDASDINGILAAKRRTLDSGRLLEYVEAPVDLSEIGGLRRLKHWLKLRQQAMSDEAAKFGITAPRGVLMLGVQGAGKSLCAKAIATAWQRPLMRMDVGALYDKYIGESERRLRDALKQAESMAPIILWIDEIEKAFASAASRSTDGGLSQRMFGSLLTWMQEHRAPVFLVATANDIEALPPELLRKGRFDEIFFVDLPEASTRREIFAIHLRKRGRDPEKFDLDKLAERSEGFSGAEIEQAVVSGLHHAFAEGAALDTDRLLQALEQSPPLSVTMAESVQALRQWAKGRCMPAD
ncbi:MAG TPA: AAA family ATPase [Phycisphaerae bacterium]|nr:AAA family ATPase [Phycisphaerae bacterium]HRR85035.1 AAA family ATPase [Phycisphaerae bacterium]